MSSPWPHQFTKNGKAKVGFDGQEWQDMVCVHCYVEYTRGLNARPPDPCPARTDKREMKRIRG